MTELVTAKKSKGEILVFRRGYRPAQFKESKGDLEATGGALTPAVPVNAAVTEKGSGSEKQNLKHVNVFHWK